MTFDLISGLQMQIQTWHPPLRLCIQAKYYVKSGLTNVLKNADKTKNMHLFSIRIANYNRIDEYGTKNASIADKSAASAAARSKALVLLLLTHCSLGLPLFAGFFLWWSIFVV